MTVIETSEIEAKVLDEVAIADPAPERDELVIRPVRGWIGIDWAEIVRYRELIAFLVWRDLKVRYKQTALGVAWAVLQPLVTVAIFTLIFSRLAGLPSDGVPYPVFALAALLPWQLFSAAVSGSSNSLVGS